MKFKLSVFCFLIFLTCRVFAQTSDVTFEQLELIGIGSISIPSIMELQAGLYKEFSDKRSNDFLIKKGIEAYENHIIFQQKGQNEFRKVNTYARVIIATEIGKAGDYRKITSKISLTKQQLKTLDSEAKTEIEFSFQGTKLKIIRWDGVSVVTINGRSALKFAYLRQVSNNPPVYVELYQIDNYDRRYVLTISYRQEDASIWEEVLRKTKNSFTVTNVKQPITKKKRKR